MTQSSSNLWGGRFSSSPEASMFALSRSVHFDWRLAPYDLRSSLAHVEVLESQKIIPSDVAAKIRMALKELQHEVKTGSFGPNESDEDVHSALERGLKEKLGDIGGAIRAGRSRNDQVATDFRLYLIDQMIDIASSLILLEKAITELATNYVDDVAPGFTHLQHAQPVSFGHVSEACTCRCSRCFKDCRLVKAFKFLTSWRWRTLRFFAAIATREDR